RSQRLLIKNKSNKMARIMVQKWLEMAFEENETMMKLLKHQSLSVRTQVVSSYQDAVNAINQSFFNEDEISTWNFGISMYKSKINYSAFCVTFVKNDELFGKSATVLSLDFFGALYAALDKLDGFTDKECHSIIKL
ncbi:MAG: hypothetical protein ACRCXK_14285, partial [Wohlfahrtiimonas sp.]